MFKTQTFVALLLVMAAACGDDDGMGGDGGALPQDGGGSFDGAVSRQDGGAEEDGGTVMDGGVARDSGSTDAGDTADAGTDAGSTDVGVPTDAGPLICSPDATLSGRIRARSGTDMFEITVTENTSGRLELVHKLDVDPEESGCIAEFDLDVRFHPSGCEFRLELQSTSEGHLLIRDIELSADSFCAGFPDASEGEYTEPYDPSRAVRRRELRPLGSGRVGGGDMARSCDPRRTYRFPDEWIRLREGVSRFVRSELWVNLSELEVTGQFESVGDTDARCPNDAPVDDGWFDTGDGWRASTPFCGPDYLFRDVDDRVCVRTPLFQSGSDMHFLPELPGYAQESYRGFLSNTVVVEFDAEAGTTYEIMAFRQDPSRLTGIECVRGADIDAAQLRILDPLDAQVVRNTERLLLDGCDPYAFTAAETGRYTVYTAVNVRNPRAASDVLAVRVRPR